MSSSIRYIVNAPDNGSVATSHTDNAIRLVDSARKIASAIVGFVKHEPILNSESLKESVMPTGLVPEPRTGGFFLNAQAGSLQLYDPHRNTMIFNVFSHFLMILRKWRNNRLSFCVSDGHCKPQRADERTVSSDWQR
jgi:hypothetical protein